MSGEEIAWSPVSAVCLASGDHQDAAAAAALRGFDDEFSLVPQQLGEATHVSCRSITA